MIKKCLLLLFLYNSILGQMIFPDNQIILSNKYTVQKEDNANFINFNSIIKNNGISNGLNNFALNINKVLLNKMEEPINQNINLSPLSIAGALSLLTLGSVGKTYDELAKVLGIFNEINTSRSVHLEFGHLLDKIRGKGLYQSNGNTMRKLSYGNAIFLQNNYPIRQQYEDMVRNTYKCDIVQVDFQHNSVEALNIINKWVYDETNGKIQNILNTIPPHDTRLIIASALYFNAEWEKYFLDGLTEKTAFIPDRRFPENFLNVDMMANEGKFPFYKSDEHECMIIGLPYKGNKTTLYAIKPIDSTRKNLKQLLNELTADKLNYLINTARRQSTIVLFPKMKLSSTYNLKDVLQNMGIKSVFSHSDANLALISPVSSIASIPEKNTYQIREEEQKFISSRIGEENEKTKCAEVFQFKDSMTANCTLSEVVNGQRIQVIYKRIGNQIGRKIVKRNTNSHDDNFKLIRFRRQLELNRWNPGLYVDEIVHKVSIDITETGTEAAASTVVFITKDGRRPVFRADEPFFFIIMDDDTNLMLFSSIVYNPQQ